MLPREKLAKLGPEMLTTEELLAIILGSGTKESNVFKLAQKTLPQLYRYRSNLSKLENTLKNIKGLGQAKISKIIAILELHKRLVQPSRQLTDPKQIFNWFYFLTKLQQEHLYAIYLNASFGYVHHQLIFKGSLATIFLSEREIFMLAYKYQAPYLILIHNHPSGIVLPSKNDKEITEILVQKAAYLGLTILDHIIVASNGYFSFRENEVLKEHKQSKNAKAKQPVP